MADQANKLTIDERREGILALLTSHSSDTVTVERVMEEYGVSRSTAKLDLKWCREQLSGDTEDDEDDAADEYNPDEKGPEGDTVETQSGSDQEADAAASGLLEGPADLPPADEEWAVIDVTKAIQDAFADGARVSTQPGWKSRVRRQNEELVERFRVRKGSWLWKRLPARQRASGIVSRRALLIAGHNVARLLRMGIVTRIERQEAEPGP